MKEKLAKLKELLKTKKKIWIPIAASFCVCLVVVISVLMPVTHSGYAGNDTDEGVQDVPSDDPSENNENEEEKDSSDEESNQNRDETDDPIDEEKENDYPPDDEIYTDKWIDKTTAEKVDDTLKMRVVITEIYPDCFFAVTSSEYSNYLLKINGSLPGNWYSGEAVICTYYNIYIDRDNNRMEGDLIEIEDPYQQKPYPSPRPALKPVIYLYPEEETEVSVLLECDGKLTCTYPAYDNGWNVTAQLDGTLIDKKGQSYNYLYWEGELNAQYDFSKGFCVKGEDTAEFLEITLEKLGLTRREANEFIVFWLPMMQDNEYNIISFQGDSYTESAKLEVYPTPDTVIRLFMAWKSSDEYIEIPEQILTAPEREGFTVIEWGGTEIK